MTSVTTGPLPDSSLRPSCSCNATNIEGRSVGSEGRGGRIVPAGSGTIRGTPSEVPSRENLTRISNRPLIPVLSITGRSNGSVLENSSRVAPLASTEGGISLIKLPQYPVPGWSGGGGTDQGVQLPSVNGCNFGPPRAAVKK